MAQITNYLIEFARDESGQDLIEYALLVALIALGSAALPVQLGSSSSSLAHQGQGYMHKAEGKALGHHR
jgi:Flp pilus assembly pilin Flp